MARIVRLGAMSEKLLPVMDTLGRYFMPEHEEISIDAAMAQRIVFMASFWA